MNDLLTRSLADIVNTDHRAATVFEKYQLDFCCKGKRSLEQACRESAINAGDVAVELESVTREKETGEAWPETPSGLIDYIVETHHSFVKRELPLIMGYLDKVSAKHGGRHPELVKIREEFAAVKEELEMHLQKEELILFPRIREIEALSATGKQPAIDRNYLLAPVLVMEHEHDDAGNGMARIRELSSGYMPPADACTTYRLSFAALDAFERDLHRHVHLENNLLFPKAVALLS